MVQVIVHLPSECKVLSSNSSTEKVEWEGRFGISKDSVLNLEMAAFLCLHMVLSISMSK
jgi:hypothetical protein